MQSNAVVLDGRAETIEASRCTALVTRRSHAGPRRAGRR